MNDTIDSAQIEAEFKDTIPSGLLREALLSVTWDLQRIVLAASRPESLA